MNFQVCLLVCSPGRANHAAAAGEFAVVAFGAPTRPCSLEGRSPEWAPCAWREPPCVVSLIWCGCCGEGSGAQEEADLAVGRRLCDAGRPAERLSGWAATRAAAIESKPVCSINSELKCCPRARSRPKAPSGLGGRCLAPMRCMSLTRRSGCAIDKHEKGAPPRDVKILRFAMDEMRARRGRQMYNTRSLDRKGGPPALNLWRVGKAGPRGWHSMQLALALARSPRQGRGRRMHAGAAVLGRNLSRKAGRPAWRRGQLPESSTRTGGNNQGIIR
jgi:hypothetical protein